MPRLAEKRNVYWNANSVRLVNDGKMTVDEQSWLPPSVPATSPIEPVAHRIAFPGGRTVLVQPVATAAYAFPDDGFRLAVVLDRSRSMAEHAVDVEAALLRLAEVAGSDESVDVYLTASQYRGEAPSRASLAEIVPGEIIYYGGQNAAELLIQFEELRAGNGYDVIFVLTDGSGYKLDGQGVDVPIPDAPVWMVHLSDEFPLGYDDATLEAIQASGGGVAGSVDEALTRSAVAVQSLGAAAVDVIDGYTWLVLPTEAAQSHADAIADDGVIDLPSSDFAAFAARRLILAEMQRQRGALDQLDVLDYLHAIAVEHSVVTPYSSMIVLVMERQEKMLEELEEADDRFEREHEAVGETRPPETTEVAGVPEPEEWLLLALAAGMLIWYLYTKRLVPSRRRISF
jgi:putative PEP-CTERM system integral membrane protein